MRPGLGIPDVRHSVFRILPRVWQLAFGQKGIPRDVGHSDDFHKIIGSKTIRAMLWLNSQDTPMKAAVGTVLTAYVDGLLQTLQHMEEDQAKKDDCQAAKEPLIPSLLTDKSPVLQCLMEYAAILENPLDSPIACVLHHFKPRGLDYVHICMRFTVATSLMLAGQIWRLLYSVFQDYPTVA